MSEPLIPKHGGYRNLKSFQISRLIYDATVKFCERYVPRGSRTRDQMIQAARSGVQNIAEGSCASGTSRKTEMKLTSVARASLEELRLDYEDFLRQKGQAILDPYDPILMRFKALRCKNLEELQNWVSAERADARDRRRAEPAPELLVANATLSLIHLASYLLGRQLEAQAAHFQQQGGFSERLYQLRKSGDRGTGR